MKMISELKRARGGFVRDSDLPDVIQANRLEPLLVRMGCGRFIAPAQDVGHFIKVLEGAADGCCYVRDVSFPAGPRGGSPSDDENTLASLKQVKDFFNIGNAATFTKEWSQLSDDERARFRGLVAEAIVRGGGQL